MKIQIIASVDIDALKTETNTSCESVDDILSTIRNECHWLDESGIHVDTVEIVEMSEEAESWKGKNDEERR